MEIIDHLLDDFSITYNNWKTGEKITHHLNQTSPKQEKTGLSCPFDYTEVIFENNEKDPKFYCLNCGIDYSSINELDQDSVESVAIQYFQNLETKLKESCEKAIRTPKSEKKEKRRLLEEQKNMSKMLRVAKMRKIYGLKDKK